MNTSETIRTRTSVRTFTDQKISPEDIHDILEAGMSGPSCTNARDYAFIVVEDKEMLNKMADANGRPAEPLRNAALGILACGDMERAFKGAPDYFAVDVSIAVQNMILAAWEKGIGSVWLGTWPQENRVQNQRELFRLPETIIPHSLIAFGYPKEEVKAKDHWEEDRVHYERW